MQQQNINLTQILASVLNPEQNINSSAQEIIQKISNDNFGGFFYELSKILSNEKEINTVRQLSATIIKNKIQNSTELWHNLDENFKTEIKKYILETNNTRYCC